MKHCTSTNNMPYMPIVLMNDDKAKQISNLRTQYAVNQKEKELNDVAQRQGIISEAAIGRQKLVRNFSIASGFFMFIVSRIFFSTIQR
jgi:hypothetical protein